MSFNSDWLRRHRMLVAIASLFVATMAWAATTGKIAGTVVDENGDPMPGVAVTIEGTRLGATTDANGRYFILRVSPGTYTVRAILIGYRTTAVTDVRVNADLTTEVNFRLAEQTIEMGDVVVTASRPDIEADVTSSQTIVDANSVADMPATRLADVLNYEPGVGVNENYDFQIRGGGASEVRFQVDGVDRTDPLTRKGRAQLNQMLVSEVTVLTGGFNAEYGNMRSGMVNAVLKDGTERGLGLPWIAGAAAYAPAGKKHFGPGAYDEDQYDYMVMSSAADPEIAAMALEDGVPWPYLYEETRNDAELMAAVEATPSSYTAPGIGSFKGWESAAVTAQTKPPFDMATFQPIGAYGNNDWTAEELRSAWEYEANMNEVAWEYGHEPDINLDLAAGWALPAQIGGIVVGYSRSKVMTQIPALIPYYLDEKIEAKLTLTPIDALKISFRYSTEETESTGGGAKVVSMTEGELSSTGSQVKGGDPVSLRSFSDLTTNFSDPANGAGKLHLSYNSPLSGQFDHVDASLTYTLGPATFMNLLVARSTSEWNMGRDFPRVDLTDFDPLHQYKPTGQFGAQTWMHQAFQWTDVDDDGKPDKPVSLEDATNPDRVIMREPWGTNAYREVPSESRYITHEMFLAGTDGLPDTAYVVSPQGWVQDPYKDLTGTYGLGGGGDTDMWQRSTQYMAKFDFTRAVGAHTFKLGGEFLTADLELESDLASRVMGSASNTEYRNYGTPDYQGWPDVDPTYMAAFVQDKYESEGMIANFGVRVERFNGGQIHPLKDSLFYAPVFDQSKNGQGVRAELNADRPEDDQVLPGEIYASLPHTDAETHWRIGPRFGVSHPVTERTKFFFNYGVFYSMQKAAVMYGIIEHDQQIGGPGRLEQWLNPSLRPARTTMYEVGLEHVLPLRIVTTFRGYAKASEDQVSQLIVNGGSAGGGTISYQRFRNANFERVRGLEIKIHRSAGRFVNGWFTYQRQSTQQGYVGFDRVSNESMDPRVPWAGRDQTRGSYQAALRLGTPMDWGVAGGGWSATIVQSYSESGEQLYNPDNREPRELPEENWIPAVDNYSTDGKLSKSFRLPGGRSLQLYVDIKNVLNRKTLNGYWLNDGDYMAYLVQRRGLGEDLKYGEESTFDLFTEPWKDVDGNWKAPIDPRNEWLHHINPRSFTFGLRFQL